MVAGLLGHLASWAILWLWLIDPKIFAGLLGYSLALAD
jgi:hypothetical protein